MTSRGFSPTGLRFENIEKRFGTLYALRRVRFEISPGECVVLAGRNGSGKDHACCASPRDSSAPSPASSLSRPHSPGASSAPAKLAAGYVGHTTMVYDELTAEENLLLFARLQKVESPVARAEDLLQRSRPLRTPRLAGPHFFPRHAPAHRHRSRFAPSPVGSAPRRACHRSRSLGHHLARQLRCANCSAPAAPSS